MIFVTVGTHEQAFERLVKEIDRLKAEQLIDDEVLIQTGYTTYQSEHCQTVPLLSYDQMNRYLEQADVVITHGGPATFMSVVSKGRVPIVVPRQKQYDEHVNDHQLEFVKQIADRYDMIVVEEVETLLSAITEAKKRSHDRRGSSNRVRFIAQLETLIGELL